MDDSLMQRDPLEVLAGEFVDSQRAGESPSMDEYIARHPDLAEQIRELFPTIEAMERLKARSERSADGLASLGPVKLEQLGEFHIVREIGRGGMGIVFEATQESLGRRVALKVLPRQALLEQRHLARFHREAKIASRLHHTNIVQVYGVGQDDGFHYYIMQYVRGVGLDSVFRRMQGPAENSEAPDELLEAVAAPAGRADTTERWRFVAALGRQVADALEYAHEQGTLHRDIKPSNLLLDDEGTVWVTDFGLARAANFPQVTQDGDLTGTLRYLAPERLTGQTDERGDIYGLGLTLYELLTLRPAYEDSDRSTLIGQISLQTLKRPRSVNPLIPRDLETIVLKAISPEPRDRYASAAAMGDDLRRFVEDRPVLARRIGPAERLWRWCRRNKAVASLAASTFVLILAVAVMAMVGYGRTRSLLELEANQRKRAEAVSAVASDALDRVFARLGPGRVVQSSLKIGASGASVQVMGQAAISKETAALLEEMLPFYDRLAEQMSDDAPLQRRAAGARRRVGDIRRRLGQFDLAEQAYLKAADLYAKLAALNPDNPALPVKMARTYNELGKTRKLAGKIDQARNAHLKSLGFLKDAGTKGSAEARFELARTYFFLGQRTPPNPGSQRKRRPPGGRSPGRRPPDHGPRRREGPGFERRPEDGPDRRPARRPDRRPEDEFDRRPDRRPEDEFDLRPARGREDRPDRRPGEGLLNDPNREERNNNLNRAISLLTELRKEQPDNPDYQHLLALCYREIVPDTAEASREAIEKSIELLEGLAKSYPGLPDYSFDLCQTYSSIEAFGRRPSDDDRRVMGLRLNKALEIAAKLVAEHPNVPEYLASEARINHRFAELFVMQDRPGQAEKNARKAVDVQTRLAQRYPGIVTYQIWRSAYQNALTRVLLLVDKLEEAESVARANITATDALLDKHPELWYLHGLLMDANHMLAGALRRSGQDELSDDVRQKVDMHRLMLQDASGDHEPNRSP